MAVGDSEDISGWRSLDKGEGSVVAFLRTGKFRDGEGDGVVEGRRLVVGLGTETASEGLLVLVVLASVVAAML